MRLSDAGLDSARKMSKLSMRTRMLDRRTGEHRIDIKGFKGLRTSLHQRSGRERISLAKTRQSEFPEVDTAR